MTAALSTASLFIASACSFAAMMLAAGSLYTGTGQRGLPGCGAGSSCDEVTRGRWSRIGSLPVALPGVVAYGVLSVAALILSFGPQGSRGNGIFWAAETLAWICVAAAVWFSLLQALVIRRICAYCLATHLLGVTASLAVVLSGIVHHASATAVAIAAVSVLIAAQLRFKVRRYSYTSIDPPNRKLPAGPEDPDPEATDPRKVSIAPEPDHLKIYVPKHRQIVLASGRMLFDLFDFPLLGSPDAPHVLAAFIDFTCTECHRLHKILRQLAAREDGRIAVSLMPVPLHEGCNPTVDCHRVDQAYACKYARLAWRLFAADRSAYSAWDEFLSEPIEAQPYGLALIRAKELADLGGFNPGEPDPAVDGRIAAGIALYQSATKPKVPAVALRGGIVQGHVPNLESFFELIRPHVEETP